MLQISFLLTSLLLLLGTASAVNTAATKTDPTVPARPTHVAIMALPRFVGLDAYGPIEFFNIASNLAGFKLSVIGETSGLIYSHAQNTTGLVAASTFGLQPDIDVLLIPGGPATRTAINNPEVINYVRNVYPKLKYMLSVCTGAQVLARAGVLDGKNATTNKFSWNEMTASGPKVNWISHARWVIDGNVWTSSGVTAGMDMVHHFLTYAFQNATMADRIAAILEHDTIRNATYDPFADFWGAKDVPPKEF